jgi:hypothetical protein
MGGTHWCKGGTGKAEAAKLPGTGIWPEALPRKMNGRKRLTARRMVLISVAEIMRGGV